MLSIALSTLPRSHPAIPRVFLALLVIAVAACSSSARSGETASVVSRVAFMPGELHTYRLVDRAGEVVGTGAFTTDRDGDTWVLTQSYEDLDGVVVDESRVVVDATTLQPRSTERTLTRGDEVERVTAVYELDAAGNRTVRATHTRGNDKRQRILELNEHDYEDQSSLWLWRTLALGEGLDVRYTTVDPREGGRVTANVIQVDRQTVETPGLTYDTWVLQIRTGRETVNVWVHVNPPHQIVRFDNGRLFFELEWDGIR